MKNKKVLVGVSIFFLGVCFVFAGWYFRQNRSQELSFLAKTDFKSFVPDHSARIGNPDAPVFLTEFLDPECETCRDFYPYVEDILKEMDGKVQLVVRYAPFHGNSEFAVKIVEASRKQGKFKETLEVLFKYQPEWGSHHHPQPELIWKYLPEAGVNVDQIKKDMEDPQIMANLGKDIEDGKKLGVKYTPTYFINGKELKDFGLDQLREALMLEVENLK